MKINYQLPNTGIDISGATLAAMIDIIFQLIIFFVVTASFDNAQFDRKVVLPEVNANTKIKSLPQERLILNVKEDGAVTIGYQTIEAQKVSSELIDTLRRAKAVDTRTQLIINGDYRVKHQHIADIMDLAARAGYDNIKINAAVTTKEALLF